MKTPLSLHLFCALLVGALPLNTKAATFFSDTFSGGSTLNSTSPANPTATNTAYELISTKTWTPAPSLAANDLRFSIPATTSGSMEIEALFATNPVALAAPGDYIQLIVVFTNSSGLLTEAGQLGFGLYNSGQVKPVAGGMNGTATTSTTGVTGGAQNWQGYVGQVNYNTANSRIMTRPVQSATTGNNQDLITSGSGSSSYTGSSTVGSTFVANLTLAKGQTCTEVLTVTLSDINTLEITNTIFSGPDTNGTVLAAFGGLTTNATYLTAAFDSLAIGYRAQANSTTNVMDISSITVEGAVTPISGPPTITTQPVPVLVAANGACAFSVEASGVNVSYQWHRNGTNINTGGNLSVVTAVDRSSSSLVISPAGTVDEVSGANGYYVTVSGAGGYSTNSVTNLLTLVPATNLIWTAASGNVWDVDTTANWKDTNGNPQVFTCGDPVTFDDTAGGGSVDLTNEFLGAASVTVNSPSGYSYTFQGNGSFSGPGNLQLTGPNRLSLNVANTYTGGTLISNASAYVYLQNYGGLGTGPIILAQAGGQMEIVPAGSATVGIAGDVIVADDFTIMVDNDGSFGAVFLGGMSGTPGKTLTLAAGPSNAGTTSFRVREYDANLVCDANLFLSNSTVLYAPYQASGIQTYNGVISGPGGVIHKGTTTYFNGANTYSGGMTLAIGTLGLGLGSVGSPGSLDSGPLGTGPLFLFVDSTSSSPSGNGGIFASGGSCTIGNEIQYPSGTNNLTLIIGGTNDLTLSGAFTLNGNDGTTLPAYMVRTLQVTNKTIISGAISDAGAGYGLTQIGGGVLYLDGPNTYTGPTTNSAGTLAGKGSLASAVFVGTNGTIGGGSMAGIGTLTLSSDLTLDGNVVIRLDKSLTPGQTSDLLSVSGVLTNAGTGKVTVTNLGPALVPGDRFVLFSEPLQNGGAMTVSGVGLTWTNHLSLDGSIIAGPPPVATTPPYLTNSVSGNTLTLQWPSDHIGWQLQAQTNTQGAGISTNANDWVNVGGTTVTNKVIISIDPSKSSVFFRLLYP